MPECDRQYAYFSITGSFNPDEITSLLRVIPTQSWAEGDPHPKNPSKRKFSKWSLYSRLDESEPIEKHVCDVLDQLDRNVEGFIHVSELHHGTMQMVGHFYAMYPGWSFDANTILRLARYSLCFDFDFYEYHSDDINNVLN